MKEPANKTKFNPLQRRRAPRQQRSEKRINEILGATARLLGEVGLDDLTTVLIARELGISVGSVYHYFPNKFSILYAVGERWLEDMIIVLDSVENWNLEEMDVENFIDQYCDEMLVTYRRQISVLPLVKAMFAMPELHSLDQRHDQIIISCLMNVYSRLGSTKKSDELNRIGRLVLEVSHALFLVIIEQNEKRGAATLADLKRMLRNYLKPLMT